MKKIVEKNFNTSNRVSILTGDIDNLETDATSNCVVAINEVNKNGFSDDTLNYTNENDIGIIAWWKMDDVSGYYVKDWSINNIDGTSVNNISTMHIDGIHNSALEFNGLTDYVIVGTNDLLNMDTSDFSISFWMKTSVSTSAMRIISKRGAPDGYELVLRADSNTIGLVIGDTSGLTYGSFGGSVNLRDNEWHHIVVTFNRDENATLYVDGSQDGIKDISLRQLTITNASNLYIGRYSPAAQHFLNGSLDDMRIYKKLLTQDEVTDLYNDTQVPTNDSLVEAINLINSKNLGFGPSYIELTFACDMYDCDGGLTYYS